MIKNTPNERVAKRRLLEEARIRSADSILANGLIPSSFDPSLTKDETDDTDEGILSATG
jgi:hypothetical protein